MSKLISLSDISGLSDNSWINGSFKAIVTNPKSPSGKSPGKAVLVDPDNNAVTMDANFWGREPSHLEGKIVSFSGAGMKKTSYKDKPQVNINDKTKVDVFQEVEAGKHTPIKSPAAIAASQPVKQGDFTEEMNKIGQTWLHALRVALQTKELALITFQHELTEEQFQALVSSIFIEANRKGLGANPPVVKALGSAPVATPAPEPKQQEDQDNPF